MHHELAEIGRAIARMIQSIKDGIDAKLIAAEMNAAGERKEAIEAIRQADDPPSERC